MDSSRSTLNSAVYHNREGTCGFRDTKGIENWEKESLQNRIDNLLNENTTERASAIFFVTKPVDRHENVAWLLQELPKRCQENHICFVLIISNALELDLNSRAEYQNIMSIHGNSSIIEEYAKGNSPSNLPSFQARQYGGKNIYSIEVNSAEKEIFNRKILTFGRDQIFQVLAQSLTPVEFAQFIAGIRDEAGFRSAISRFFLHLKKFFLNRHPILHHYQEIMKSNEKPK